MLGIRHRDLHSHLDSPAFHSSNDFGELQIDLKALFKIPIHPFFLPSLPPFLPSSLPSFLRQGLATLVLWQSSCLYFMGVGITGMCHHMWPKTTTLFFFKKCVLTCNMQSRGQKTTVFSFPFILKQGLFPATWHKLGEVILSLAYECWVIALTTVFMWVWESGFRSSLYGKFFTYEITF